MTLPFSLVCDLLDECHRLCLLRRPNAPAVAEWFRRHRSLIDAPDTDLSALLSTLLPEKRTDRVYCLQAATLERIVGRALGLGASRIAELARYRQPGLGLDLADCVERLLTATPNPAYSGGHGVTVEEIDGLLHGLASRITWSSPAIRRSQTSLTACSRDDLQSIYQRLDAREAKWLTRLVLKDYKPMILDSHFIYARCHSALPDILLIQEDFTTAIKTLQGVRGPTHHGSMITSVKPKLGVKVGRQNWFKARSIKHCLTYCHGIMSVEDKIDGEYCQIHVDATSSPPRIQIFSKSGKDSTEDRQGIRDPISKSLNLSATAPDVVKNCILEGELVVYSDVDNVILPFHKIRHYVTRRGRFSSMDHVTSSGDGSLMIVYFDILFLNDRSLLGVRRSERFKLLQQTVRCQRGRAELVPRQTIDFGSRYAASDLRQAFAKNIVSRGEGLVLKPNDPYFNFDDDSQGRAGLCVKLKKDYIGNFGDVGDFAVVGAGFDAAKARSHMIDGLMWTHFFLGCLDNREEVTRWRAPPEFTVVTIVELNETQLKTLIKFADPMPVAPADNVYTKLKLPRGLKSKIPMRFAFRNPLVFDLRCFSFDRPANMGFWVPRFPVVTRIHFDRDFTDVMSLARLQEKAKEATTGPEMDDSKENLAWIAKLECADPQGRAVDAVSQLTATTMPTPSPTKPSQPTPVSNLQPWPTAALPESIPETVDMAKTPRDEPGRPDTLPAPLPTTLVAVPGEEAETPARPLSSLLRKRQAPLSPESVPPRRRRPHAEAAEAAASSAARSAAREALGDVDGNTPQNSPPRHSYAASQTVGKAESKAPADVAAAEAAARKSGGGVQQGSVGPRASESLRGVRVASDTTKGLGTACEPEKCKYAGLKCHLAGSLVLFASDSLKDEAEAQELFRDHGILGAGATADAWLEAEVELARKEACAAPKKRQPAFLFVDSVNAAKETEELLGRIEDCRKDIPRRKRAWITVYDWRLLQYLAVLEDGAVESKYYDGFGDPWRRWYCGMV